MAVAAGVVSATVAVVARIVKYATNFRFSCFMNSRTCLCLSERMMIYNNLQEFNVQMSIEFPLILCLPFVALRVSWVTDVGKEFIAFFCQR